MKSESLQLPRPNRVLILCTGNSCRSQMAEGWWNMLAQGVWLARSAGSAPVGFVHPLAVGVMAEVGIDLSQHQSQHLDEYRDQPWDLVVTVCGSARDACPVFPAARQTLHWPVPDPAETGGEEPQQRAHFRAVRDQIRQRIEEWLASPEGKPRRPEVRWPTE